MRLKIQKTIKNPISYLSAKNHLEKADLISIQTTTNRPGLDKNIICLIPACGRQA